MSDVLVGGASVIGGFTGIGQTYVQYQYQKIQQRAANFAAQMNMKIADFEAQNVLKQAELDTTVLKGQARQLIGTQRANLAAQGIDLEDGTALELQAQTSQMAEIDALRLKNNAWRQAMGYKMSATASQWGGQMLANTYQAQAQNTLLTGGLNAVNYGFKAAGAFGAFSGGSSAPKGSEYRSSERS